ncbi:MAG: Smr/MutS family protein [Alistipes sp.]|nr:Smr/MutS family protein [Alistipes sp.]
MVYPHDFESKVGFDRLREQIAALCTMRRSRERLDGESFSDSAAEIVRRQSMTDEVGRLLSGEQEFPREDFADLDTAIAKIRIEGAFLEPSEVAVLCSSLRTAGRISEFILSRESAAYPYTQKLSGGLSPLAHIVREGERIVDEHGEVRDNASPELARLRHEIRSREGQVSKRLQQILNSAKSAGVVDADALISIRDGRAVIPVAAGNKRKLQGLVYDESATGKTVYIEPMEIVELNNALKELEYAVRRETVRILTAFTDSVRPDADSIDAANEYLAEIDMLRAKARWASENGAVKPIISDEGRLLLHNAFHPLLAQTLAAQNRQIVPLDLELDKNKRILVISGPNAGGKSVCLKSTGLLQYMFQCGFPVTASENSEFPVFESLYIDIGDEQSMDNDLSTYSSHLNNMKQMLAGASSRAMMLIDEFGSGTEPVIGGAIAEAILERFVERGCYGVVTTHYSNIKYYAANAEGIENGAMTFDVRNIRPLFRLETGKPGSSFAIEIARKTGLPEDIIRTASDKAGSEHIDLEKQLREIARDKRYWEQKRDRIRITDRKVDELEQRYRAQLERIKSERNEIIGKARQEARELIAEANRRIENTIKTIRESQAEKEATREVRKSFDDFRTGMESGDAADEERIEREMERLSRRQARRAERQKNKPADSAGQSEPMQEKPREIVEGTKVRIAGQDMIGEVKSVKGKRTQVAFGQILTTVDKALLEAVSNAEYKRQLKPPTAPRTVLSTDISQRRLNFRGSIDIRGMRVTEGLDAVQALVDDALMVGVETVTILHGKGTGALKEEVRNFLRTFPQVSSVRDEHPDRGGAGITIVTFEY